MPFQISGRVEVTKDATLAVRQALKLLKVDLGRQARGRGKAAAATTEQLRQMSAAAASRLPAIRDRALWLIAFTPSKLPRSALRASSSRVKASLEVHVPSFKEPPASDAYGRGSATCASSTPTPGPSSLPGPVDDGQPEGAQQRHGARPVPVWQGDQRDPEEARGRRRGDLHQRPEADEPLPAGRSEQRHDAHQGAARLLLREAGDWGEKSPLPDSRHNQPDDPVEATETDPLDAVPLFGKFKGEARIAIKTQVGATSRCG